MSGRLVLGSCRTLNTFPLVAVIVCSTGLLSSASAFAQSAADTPAGPVAPDAPAVAPPAPDPPAPTPSEPGPPNQAPPNTEPTPAPTPTPEAAAPTTEPPASSAAFAPLPAATREIAKPQAVQSPTPPEPVRSPPAQPISHATYDESSKDDSPGLLGPFRIGVLVGTGLPEVANFGAQLKLTRFIGLGVNVGLIPTVKVRYYGEAAQAYQEYDAYGHIYPFGGSFFLGAGVGYVKIDGTLVNRFNLADLNQPGVSGLVDVTSDASVRTLVLTPQIGFLKIFDVGFAVGFDIGAQIPIAPSEVEFNTVAVGIPPALEQQIRMKYINPNDEKVRSTLNTLGRTPLPTFSFKIGWFL